MTEEPSRPRARKGTGRVWERSPGNWYAQWGVPVEGGKRVIYKKGRFPTETAARKFVTAEMAKVEAGTFVRPTRTTFKEYAEGWLETQRVREVTAAGYRSAINTASAAFGAKAIGTVTRQDVEKLIKQMADAGRAKRSTSYTLFVIRGVLKQALHDGLVARNVADPVKPAGREPKKREAFSDAEYARLSAHFATDRWHAGWLLTMFGLRRSELLALRWTDVDLAAGTLTIARGRVPVTGRTVENGTKTSNGTRVLPIGAIPTLIAALKQLREQHAAEFGFEQARSGYLIVDEVGEPMRPERWSDTWRAHCLAAGVRSMTLYAARHTSVTAMRRAGAPDKDVAAWHGHDEVIMRRVYSHADQDGLAAAATALAGVLG